MSESAFYIRALYENEKGFDFSDTYFIRCTIVEYSISRLATCLVTSWLSLGYE